LKARAGEKFFQMMVEMSPQQVLGQITKWFFYIEFNNDNWEFEHLLLNKILQQCL
jgi:hypothetical protein